MLRYETLHLGQYYTNEYEITWRNYCRIQVKYKYAQPSETKSKKKEQLVNPTTVTSKIYENIYSISLCHCKNLHNCTGNDEMLEDNFAEQQQIKLQVGEIIAKRFKQYSSIYQNACFRTSLQITKLEAAALHNRNCMF